MPVNHNRAGDIFKFLINMNIKNGTGMTALEDWTDSQALTSLIMLNLAGGTSVDAFSFASR